MHGGTRWQAPAHRTGPQAGLGPRLKTRPMNVEAGSHSLRPYAARYAHVSPRLGHIPDIYELYRALSRMTGQAEPASSAQEAATAGR
jgi:hypothetical protein